MLCFSLGGYKFEIKAVYNRDHVTEKIRKTKREKKACRGISQFKHNASMQKAPTRRRFTIKQGVATLYKDRQ